MTTTMVIRPGALGDVILTLPALAWLGRSDTGLTVAVSRKSGDIVAGSFPDCRILDYQSQVMTNLFNPQPDWQKLRKDFEGFDRAILWMKAADATMMDHFSALGIKDIRVIDPWPKERIHAATHLARSVGCQDSAWSGTLPLFLLPEPVITKCRDLLEKADIPLNQFVFVHPGSGSPRKNWMPRYFAEVLKALNFPPVILAPGDTDRDATDQFLREIPKGMRSSRFEGLNVLEIAGLLTGARLYLGNDSGISHLAALCRAPSLLVFGPTAPEVWRPLGRHVRVCVHDGFPDAPEEAGGIFRLIPEDEVMTLAEIQDLARQYSLAKTPACAGTAGRQRIAEIDWSHDRKP